jgi:cell division septum initiation protein DivIVA
MPVDQQFNIINEKLQQLLKQQNRLKKENERLRTELEVKK